MEYNSYGGGGNNQYNTSYGAQGGAGGGGFMNSGSQQDQSAGRSYGENTLRPVTIKQINDAQASNQDIFMLDNIKLTELTFVGQIRNISTQATHHTYKLDDGTGTVEVKKWLDVDDSAATNGEGDGKSKLIENGYARVFGKLKQFNNKKHVGAMAIRPISDYNEIQYHLLEATVVHLHHTRGPPTAGQTNGNNGAQNNQDHAMSGMDGGTKVLPASLSANARRVVGCLQGAKETNEGLHSQDIAVRLNMDMSDVHKAGDQLLEQGLIYTTVDDSTWALLDL